MFCAAMAARCKSLRAFQLRVLLHQLLQTEARELYRNLCIFPISFALIDRPFAVFRMLDLLSGTKSALARGLFHRQLRDMELLAAGGKKLGNVVDGVVVSYRRRRFCLDPSRIPTGALVFIFVRIVDRLPAL